MWQWSRKWQVAKEPSEWFSTTIGCSFISCLLRRGSVLDLAPPLSGYWATGRPPNSRQVTGATLHYGVPDGAPAICQAKASGEDAVKSMAGSTVEYDCTKSLYTALPLNCAKTSTPLGGHATIPESVPLAAMEFGPSTAAPERNGGPFGGVGTRFVTWCCMQSGNVLPSFTISDVPQAFAPRILAN